MNGFLSAPRGVLLAAGLVVLAGCEEGQMPGFLQPADRGADGAETVSRNARTVERDIEAPEIFQTSEAGLWDGRPSLGGVWVAHPDVSDPERVIIRNEQNGQFVIGALFRREREAPGPRLQVSSDAAAALGLLAGAPTNLNVVALRREEVAEDPAPMSDLATPEDAAFEAPSEITEGTIDPVAAGAAAVLAQDTPAAAAEPAPQLAAATPPSAPPRATGSALSKPFVQIGIFSVEQNARDTATAMRQAGMVPTIKQQSSSGKTFWRVVVGPAQTKSELDTLLKTIKGTGFNDAYAVTN